MQWILWMMMPSAVIFWEKKKKVLENETLPQRNTFDGKFEQVFFLRMMEYKY